MTMILPRSAWTTTPDNRDVDLQPSRVNALTAHYPADGNVTHRDLTQEQVAAKLRGYRNGHTAKGWRDIGYNYAIDQSGRIWFLTGLDVGAHANAVGNTTSVGVLFVVGNTEPISAAAIEAFRWLRQYVIGKGYTKATKVQGHQQVPGNSTSCPGAPLMALIKSGALAQPPGGVIVTPPKPQIAVWDLPSTWAIGSTGDAVTKLGQRLVIWAKHLGLSAPYSVGPGPEFTETDRAAVAAFQRAQGWTGADADGYPGPETFRRLASTPTRPKPDPDPDDGPLVEYISANLAGYNNPHGMKTAVDRAKRDIPDYLRPKAPLWYHFQECSKPMLEHLDKALPEYKRVSAGGKGRESYYRRDAGIKILKAELLNVKHMLLKDTKEHLVIAWEIDGAQAVDVNFHNENEGSTFQPLQLRDVMNSGRTMADEHGIDRANIAITGDANLKTAAAFAWAQRWAEASHIAKKKIDLGYTTLNRWSARLIKGRRIDVDIFQRDANVLEAEVLFGALISDHWAHRVLRRLKKK